MVLPTISYQGAPWVLKSSVLEETSRVEAAIEKGTSDIDVAKDILLVETEKPVSQRDEQAKVGKMVLAPGCNWSHGGT